jgi:hypothetical protein
MSSYTSIYTAPKSYHSTYWITNTKLHKHYIGVHTSKLPPIHDLGIKYFSSSLDKEFKKDQKDNPQDYEYKIIGLFPTREEASLNEIELHETYGVGKNTRFYNRCKSTTTGFNRSGVEVAKKTKKKMSESAKNRDPHSAESKDKMSESAKNRPPVKEETKDKMSYSAKNRPPPSAESNKKRSEALLGKKMKTGTCPHCGIVMALNKLKRFHLDNCKLKSLLVPQH